MSEPAVLVTRPAGQETALCSRLQRAGYQPVVCPLISIEPLPEMVPAQRNILENLDHYQHVIFVSSNAVRFGMAWIGDFWPQLPVDLNWYTVGEGSARKLASFGVLVQRPATEMTSEGLLEMASLQQLQQQKVLIVKGEGGRDFLRNCLSERGAQVDELATYSRSRPALPSGDLFALIRHNSCQALMLSSGEGLLNMVSLLTEDELAALRSLPLIVPSERVAQQAREYGFSDVTVARNASDQEMAATLATRMPSRRERE
jgi:uroporphyrinogen-III synthase